MKPYKRRHFFIDKKLQTKYALLTVILLFVYTGLLVVSIFLPYILPLEMGGTIEEQTKAARMLLSLHKSVWPAIGLSILVMSGLSIFITHQMAGPVYRFRKVLAEISAGNLDLNIKLRKNDDLQDLASDMNAVIGELREFVQTLKSDHEIMSSCIQSLEEQIRNKTIDDTSGRDLISRMQERRENIARALDKYSIQ